MLFYALKSHPPYIRDGGPWFHSVYSILLLSLKAYNGDYP
jgi:hypothetical protein